MSDLMLKTAVRMQNTMAEAMERRADDKGQTAVEYLGIIAVVVAIVLAITGTDIGKTILDKITNLVNKVGESK
ncbi:Flp family type IVb pilin [Streptomyces sp. Caat 7-52]|uniref:Flp family type IVb pilin n=1 Tax=Streptomyces sp. Caat 7-52 TaxID=2949637 RepID=UPI002035EBFF|nr:Flp family type IVb pilin [Streptomyces sp. Caat 7-52]